MMLVAVNELGRRIGDSHHNAVLTNGEVELLLILYTQGFGYRRLSQMFEISKSLARNIVKGRTRCQSVHEWRKVHVKETPLVIVDV